ncbi:hypothetical protein HK101_008158 [Irineochytrium annulatum]|nr:hypothetical protein HK101_008158 [Irineochytrium annulatum]
MTELMRPRTDGNYYRFNYTSLRHKCTLVHFQLRNLVWATSKNDVYYSYRSYVNRWCPVTRKPYPAVNVGPNVKISTLSAKGRLLFVGGYSGEYFFRRLEAGAPVASGKLTADPNGITNHAEINESRGGASIAIVSSNDCKTRVMDLVRLQVTSEFELPWPVNCSSLSPDKRLICIVGDERDTKIVNSDTGQLSLELRGHLDFSFACAWSPCGKYIATGNQDMSTRIYDMRNTSKTIAVLPGVMGAIRSLRFSDDGRYLAAAEPADFVHVYDFRDPGYRSQVVDFFGEISGVSFTPEDAEALYIGNSDEQYGSILEFIRERRSRLTPTSDIFI